MNRRSTMLIPTIIMGVIAFVLLAVGWSKGNAGHIAGVKMGAKMMAEILPLLFFAFIIAGMIQVLLPQQALAKWIGEEAGIKGILIGTVAGGLTPGGPYVSLPIVAGLMKSGAGIGTLVAFMTGWSLWAVARLPMEVGILGWKFTLIRLGSTFLLPPVAGLLAHALFSGIKT